MLPIEKPFRQMIDEYLQRLFNSGLIGQFVLLAIIWLLITLVEWIF